MCVCICVCMYVVAGASLPQVAGAGLVATLSGVAVVALSTKGSQRWESYMVRLVLRAMKAEGLISPTGKGRGAKWVSGIARNAISQEP